MKKLYTYLSIGILFLVSFTASSQVLIDQDFESSPNLPAGWVSPSLPEFVITTNLPCNGTRSARGTLNSSSTSPVLRSPFQQATGDDIEISFNYKLLQNVGSNPATNENFGSFELEYTVNGGTSWTSYHTINQSNHTSSASCTTLTHTIPAADVPAGSSFGWRVRGIFNQGNNYIYIDNFRAVEQVDCIRPIKATIGNVTFNSIEVSWLDINNPTATEWNVAYCPVGITPNNPACFFSNINNTTSNPYTIPGLDDGTEYDIYVQAVCGPGIVSAWTGPITVQTIAIGTDCTNAFEINSDTANPVATDLPFTHSSNTSIYSSSYTGSAGNFCNASGNFLNGDEVVYKYVSYDDDILQIEVSGGLTGAVGLFVYESCANIGVTCFAGETDSSGNPFGITDLFVTAGQTYYIVISTATAGSSTPYTLNITGFNCLTWEAPSSPPDGIPVDFYNQTLGDFDGTGIGVNPTITGAFLTWYEDNNGVPGAVITNTGAITLQDNDVYWVQQTIGGCDSPFLEVTFEEFDCLGKLEILTKDETDSVCDSGNVTLGVTANTSNILWYDAQTGGEVVGAGNSFTTPTITQTTSYWVSEVFFGEGITHNQAKPGPTASQSYTTNDVGVLFDVSSPMRLVSVQVFSTGAGGTIEVTLRDSSGGEQQALVNVPSGSTANPVPAMLHLNFDINTPGQYRLLKTSGATPMMGSAAGTTNFPYSIGLVGEVTNGATATGTSTIYYYFYNWTIREKQALCESPREEIIATVHETQPVSVTATDFSVCVGQTTTLTASSPDPDYNYTWSWTDPSGQNQTATGASTTVTIAQNTTYTVKGINPITGCEDETTIEIEAIGAGEINVTPEIVDTCVGNIVELTAGGIYHTFNEQVTGWTTTNSSTGPASPADARWKLVSSPYNPADGATSNDGSQFYIAVADAVGPEGQVNTQLTSPSFNLVGVQNASLTFFHYYKHSREQYTQARVQVRKDNSSTWDEVAMYGSTARDCNTNVCSRGTPTNFEMVTINLSAYTGSANVQIRFNYTGKFGWWWAVDNVTISRDYTNGQVTWSGVNDLFLDSNATIPYNGTATNSVFFKSETPGTFTYDVNLNITGCGTPLTNQVTITVNETMPPTGPALQDYITGQTLFSLNVTGQDLKYYILEDGDYKRISPNTVLIHDTTYYITQTQNGCESDFMEVTVNLDCPAPTNLDVHAELGAGNKTASILVSWTRPAVSSSIQEFFIEIKDASGDRVTTKTVSGTEDYVIITQLELNADFTAEITSICDPSIPVNSVVESTTFDTRGIMSVDDINFDGFTYYPNPTRDIVTFENLLPIEQLEVYSINGQKVYEQHTINETRVQVDFSEFASGVYFSKVKVGEAVQIVRIIRE